MTKLSHLARTLPLVALAVAPAAQADWLVAAPPRAVAFRLEPSPSSGIDLLLPLRDTSADRLGPFRLYTSGPWGSWQRKPSHQLSWAGAELATDRSRSAATFRELDAIRPVAAASLGMVLHNDVAWGRHFSSSVTPWFESTGVSLRSDGFDALFQLPPERPVVDWRCRRRPVLLTRTEGESDRLELVRCDGSMAPEALDRLSILARPPDVPRPAGLLLPDEPDPIAWGKHREWSSGVRVMHPRLVWALQQIADAFPHRAITIYSGYRPHAEVNDARGHKSLHASGRALDIAVHRVENTELFRVCAKLRGVGCGFYPHNKFIHLDVRRAEAGEAFWVDASLPGEPAKYVTDYPGLVERGKVLKKP